MTGQTCEQGACTLCFEVFVRKVPRGLQRMKAEPRQEHRVSGPVQKGRKRVTQKRGPCRNQGLYKPAHRWSIRAQQIVCRPRIVQQADRVAAVQRMRQRHVRLNPVQTVLLQRQGSKEG